MGDVSARVLLPGDGASASAGQSLSVVFDRGANVVGFTNQIPCLEWCIDDDCLNMADSMSFTIANIDGENAGKIYPLQLVILQVRDPDVAGGQWVQAFKGRVMRVLSRSDEKMGSIITVETMDLGWHLTRCKAKPLVSTASGTLDQLILRIVDPSWGLNTTAVVHGNAHNRHLKQGRLGVELKFIPKLQQQFILIQTEVGQTPSQILTLYAARLGLLVNIGVNGDIILFQPDYAQQIVYDTLHYHKMSEGSRVLNNVIGTPTLEQSGEGLYSQAVCYSTVVAPDISQQAKQRVDPNSQYLHSTYTPASNPCPFTRIESFMDTEAIGDAMRTNRAIWKAQTDAFNSWSYTVEVNHHSSGGAFYASDTMIPVNDTVNRVRGSLYVQKVRRSVSKSNGTRAYLTLRLPWLLNPSLQAQVYGAGNIQTPQYSIGIVDGVLQLVPKVVQ